MPGIIRRPTSSSSGGKGFLYGLTLANNGSDPTNDIDIAAGTAIDSAGASTMTLAASITKRLDAAWAAGTNQGGLDTGAIANTTYHVWLISTGSTVDVLFSTSASAPTMPATYTLKRRIGSIIRTGAAIVGFSQRGDEFLRLVPVLDIDVTNLGTTAVLYALSVPTGIKVGAMIDMKLDPATSNPFVLVTSPDQTDTAASSSVYTLSADGEWHGHASGVWRTDTSAQIRARSDETSADLRAVTRGWIDTRERPAA